LRIGADGTLLPRGGRPRLLASIGIEVFGISPKEVAITRLVGAILLEQNDEWAVQCTRYITLETVARLSDDPLIGLPTIAA